LRSDRCQPSGLMLQDRTKTRSFTTTNQMPIKRAARFRPGCADLYSLGTHREYSPGNAASLSQPPLLPRFAEPARILLQIIGYPLTLDLKKNGIQVFPGRPVARFLGLLEFQSRGSRGGEQSARRRGGGRSDDIDANSCWYGCFSLAVPQSSPRWKKS
jgi:hypothetical protein